MPRIKSKEVDSRKFEGQTRTEIPRAPEGPIIGIDMEPIQVVDGPVMDMAAALKHAEDELLIMIHQSDQKNPEDPVMVAVNGRACYIWRGTKYLCKRKYVERLLRAQGDAVSQNTAARTEAEFNKITVRPTQRYPLSVLHDPDPNGQAWLQQITQSA